jgi:hypothetical protein
MTIIPFQQTLNKPLEKVVGNADYLSELYFINRYDRLLSESGLEKSVIIKWLENGSAKKSALAKKNNKEPKALTFKEIGSLREEAILALRSSILRKHTNSSYREMAKLLSMVPLYQKFCGINRFHEIKAPGKSRLQRLENDLGKEIIQDLNKKLLLYIRENSGQGQVVELPDPIELSECYFDTFCLKTNIHHPVDWLLFRDTTRTVMLAVARIRKHGICNRMVKTCESYMSEINALCIKMTHSSRQNKKKQYKSCFRKMRDLAREAVKHGHLHLKKLKKNRGETSLTDNEIRQIRLQITAISSQFDKVVHQAHERIIGERQIKSADKILSLYEDGVNVIVRKKAGAAVEFGNKASLMEQKNGLIVDWDLAKNGSPSDFNLTRESYNRVTESFGHIESLTGDRGCASKRNANLLKKQDTYNALCPKAVNEMQERLKDLRFCTLQKRRASTEARISILQKFTGAKLRCKSYDHRKQQLGFCVFVHNLWRVSKMMIEYEKVKDAA